MRASWYDPSTQAIVIPGEYAVKNDSKWRQPLPNEAANTLEWWLEQRENIAKYDGDDHVWLNRKGNTYSSQNLNYLLRNLMDEAGISERGRGRTKPCNARLAPSRPTAQTGPFGTQLRERYPDCILQRPLDSSQDVLTNG